MITKCPCLLLQLSESTFDPKSVTAQVNGIQKPGGSEKTDQGMIGSQREDRATEYGGDAKLVGAEYKVYGNGNKPAEGNFSGETGFKLTQDFIDKTYYSPV